MAVHGKRLFSTAEGGRGICINVGIETVAIRYPHYSMRDIELFQRLAAGEDPAAHFHKSVWKLNFRKALAPRKSTAGNLIEIVWKFDCTQLPTLLEHGMWNAVQLGRKLS